MSVKLVKDKQTKLHYVGLGLETLEAIQGPLSPKWRKELITGEELACSEYRDTDDG